MSVHYTEVKAENIPQKKKVAIDIGSPERVEGDLHIFRDGSIFSLDVEFQADDEKEKAYYVAKAAPEHVEVDSLPNTTPGAIILTQIIGARRIKKIKEWVKHISENYSPETAAPELFVLADAYFNTPSLPKKIKLLSVDDKKN